ncbi:MAG: helix-turn-helix domain-containing protein [Dermatophilaceae bacterium]
MTRTRSVQRAASGAGPGQRSAPTASFAGILRPEEFGRHVSLRREPAGASVAAWVENHWSLRWDLPDGRWFASATLPHPTCALTLEVLTHPRVDVPPGERLVVTGVVTRRFDVDVRGRGRVAGVRFRPGGLAALAGRAASAWTDRTVAARDVLPDDVCARLDDPALVEDVGAWASTAEEVLGGIRPDVDPRYELLLEVIAQMLADRALLTVAEVARRSGTTQRTLQRLFTHYVGVGPKWVLARYRMHDAVADLDAGFDGTLTELAHRYGWYDQAHFIREFTALVGVTPGEYRSRSARG